MTEISEVYDPASCSKNIDAFKSVLCEALRSALAREGKVLTQKSIPEILRELKFDALLAGGGGDLSELARVILKHSNRLHHPRYFGHQVAVPMWPSCLADLLNGFTNNGMAVYEMGPAGTAVERGVVRWMLSKCGWAHGDGVLTHGGSIANLSCLLAARARVFPQAWEAGMPRGGVLLASAAAHYSVGRAAAILGLGAAAVIKIPVDSSQRMIASELKSAYRHTLSSGQKVLAVIANAGATPTGAFDVLREVGAFCRNENLWLHVDGAHGASVLISEQHRGLLDGIELADSLSWDTHKMLGTSVLCGAALFRDASALSGTYAQHAPYLFSDVEKPGEDVSKNTLECTKSQLGLKLFFNLAVLGEKGLAAHVDRLLQRAGEIHAYISAREGFECRCAPQCNILCFRYGKDSALQDRVRAQIVLEGNFYLTRTTLDGEAWLRLVIMNPFTEVADIAALCDEIRKVAG